MVQDSNVYLKPEYPTRFTRYKGGYEMISLSMGILMGKNLDGYEYESVLPIPLYPRVKYTRIIPLLSYIKAYIS
jgi:hypothetical protein